MQLKLHLLCPFMFPSPPMLDAGLVRSARAQLAAHPDPKTAAPAAGEQPAASTPQENAAAAEETKELGAAAGGAEQAGGGAAEARGKPQLPESGGHVHSLVHLSKVVLRPLPVRGVDCADLHRPVNPGAVAAGLCATAADAVKASNGAYFPPFLEEQPPTLRTLKLQLQCWTGGQRARRSMRCRRRRRWRRSGGRP